MIGKNSTDDQEKSLQGWLITCESYAATIWNEELKPLANKLQRVAW